MANMFVNARENNLSEGKMTKGRDDVPHVASMPGAPAQSAPAHTGSSFEVTVNQRRVAISASEAEIEDFRAFLKDYAPEAEIRRLTFMHIDVLKAGLMFALPPPAPKKRKAVTAPTSKGKKRAVRLPAVLPMP